jgi:23S rRNA pseudouridine1911/1915/1917 synthase
MRFDDYISKKFIINKSKGKQIIELGNVSINNRIEKKAGYSLDIIYNEEGIDENIIKIIDNSYQCKCNKSNTKSNDIFEKLIISENKDYIIIYKPFSILSHGISEESTLLNVEDMFIDYLKKQNFPLDIPYKYKGDLLCHRLDKGSSGLMILSKNNDFKEILVNMFKNNTMEKEYYAIVVGYFPDFIEINDKIIYSSKEKKSIISEGGKESKTITSRIDYIKDYNISIVKCQPIHGRQHQIRVHLSNKGFPIIGDSLYVSDILKKKYPKFFPNTEDIKNVIFQEKLHNFIYKRIGVCFNTFFQNNIYDSMEQSLIMEIINKQHQISILCLQSSKILESEYINSEIPFSHMDFLDFYI